MNPRRKYKTAAEDLATKHESTQAAVIKAVAAEAKMRQEGQSILNGIIQEARASIALDRGADCQTYSAEAFPDAFKSTKPKRKPLSGPSKPERTVEGWLRAVWPEREITPQWCFHLRATDLPAPPWVVPHDTEYTIDFALGILPVSPEIAVEAKGEFGKPDARLRFIWASQANPETWFIWCKQHKGRRWTFELWDYRGEHRVAAGKTRGGAQKWRRPVDLKEIRGMIERTEQA